MKRLRAVLQVALLASVAWLAVAVTGPDLVRTLRINGWLPAAGTVERVAVTRKWHHPGPEGTYWVSWGDGSIPPAADRRLNVSPDLWRALPVGSGLEIVRVPGSSHPSLREDAAVPPRTVGTKAALLVIELGLALVAAGPLFRRLPRLRTRRSGGRDTFVLKVSPDFVFRSRGETRGEADDRLLFIEDEV